MTSKRCVTVIRNGTRVDFPNDAAAIDALVTGRFDTDCNGCRSVGTWQKVSRFRTSGHGAPADVPQAMEIP